MSEWLPPDEEEEREFGGLPRWFFDDDEAQPVKQWAPLAEPVPLTSLFEGGDDLEQPRPPKPSEFSADQSPRTLGERFGFLVRVLSGDVELHDDEYAGADISRPGFLSVLRRSEAEPSEASGHFDQEDDRFARLLTPLEGPSLAHVQRDHVHEDILFAELEREHRLLARQESIGLFIAMLVFALIAAGGGQHYLHGLVHVPQPAWIHHRLSQRLSGGLITGIGLLVPFALIGLFTDTVVAFLRFLNARSLLWLGIALVSATFSAIALMLLRNLYPLETAVLLLGWMIFRGFIRFVSGRDGGSR